MSRVSNAVKARYNRLNPDSEDCFYCPNPASMEDMTPSPSASEQDRESFAQNWERVPCCRTCWGKIYTANVANAGRAFGVRKGLMTIEMKRALIGGATKTDRQGFVIGFNGEWIVPAGTVLMGQNFMVGQTVIYQMEMKALQPAMGLAYLDRPRDDIRMGLHQAYASGSLDVDDAERYETLLGLQ